MTRVLTVRQPWAWCIAHGGKTIENRAQRWSYRGPLLIHAGKAFDLEASVPSHLDVPDPDSIVRSAIVAVADLWSVHHLPEDCWRACKVWGMPRHNHVVLHRPEPVPEPVPVARGALGLWKPSPGLLAAVRAQLPHRPLPDPT